MQLAWLTDIHLDFLGDIDIDRFFSDVASTGADGVLVSGDIGQARTWEAGLCRMARRLERPIWFVLGNHDYYGGSVAEVRGRAELYAALRKLGDESGEHLRRVLPSALEGFEHVIVLTHVPPFREAAWHAGGPAPDDYLPFFACGATGAVLLDEVARRPDRQVTVLCGHTHSGGECRPLPNMKVITGAGVYGKPAIQLPLIDA